MMDNICRWCGGTECHNMARYLNNDIVDSLKDMGFYDRPDEVVPSDFWQVGDTGKSIEIDPAWGKV